MKDATIGIDLGTSSVKVCAVDSYGRLLSEESQHYENKRPKPGWAEQDPEVWWNQTRIALANIIQNLKTYEEEVSLRGIGLTGQMHSLVLLDAQGNPVRPAITWLDTRARELVPEITQALKEADLLERVKNLPASGLTLASLVWLSRYEPQSLERARVLFLPKDYIRYRLTGEIFSDPTDASGTVLFDAINRNWLQSVCRLFGISVDLLPPLKDSWTSGGTVDSRRISEPHELVNLRVAIGCADQQAAAVATGVLNPERVQLMLGTGAQIAAPVASTDYDVTDTLNFFAHHTNWLAQGSIQNAGSALTWAMRILGAQWEELSEASAGSRTEKDPYFLPYLTGERTPIMNPNATGAWLNLRHDTERFDLLRSCVEGVAFGVADAFESVSRLLDLSESVELRVSGGGIRSREYAQLICDSVGKPLSILPQSNVTAIGAAILGGVAAGLYSNLQEGVATQGLKIEQRIYPDSERHKTLFHRRRNLITLRDAYLDAL